MRPYDLRCEYRENPMGIDMAAPRFYWKLKTAEPRGAMQRARHILVAESPDFSTPLWNSGMVQSGESAHVEYGGPLLKPRTRYWWRVRAWDRTGRSDGWSEAAWFETGKMGESWQARWIRAEEAEGADACPLLRRVFSVRGQVAAARVYATAKGVYRLWLNGRAVGCDMMAPGWTAYEKRLQYQTYDVTDMIRPGQNAMGAMLGRGWYSGDVGRLREWRGTPPRELLLELRITYADGSEQVVPGNGEWRAAEGPVLMSEIYHGETYDARREIPGWNQPGPCGGDWRGVAVSTGGFGAVVAQDGPPVRRIGEVRPVALFVTPAGETVLDMGQNMVGFLRFTASGNEGDRVVLKHFEVLDGDGNAYYENLRKARQTVEYTLKGGGAETYEPHFTFQGFRYAQIAEWPGEPDISCFTGVVVHSQMEPAGGFACNDGLVNRLQRNIVWSQKGNFLDVPTDCPQRDERLGWTGDAQVFAATACFNFMTAPFFTKWLRDMAAEQLASGGIPFVIPNATKGDSAAAWGDAATVCPWTVYEYYGDARLLAECYAMMRRWVEYIRAHSQDGVLWNTGFHFGDWLALDAPGEERVGATSKDLIATAFYAHSAGILAKSAAALDRMEDAAEYGRLHEKITLAFRREFVTPSGRLACPTQTAHALALRFGLLEGEAKDRAAGALKALLDERGGRLATGFVGAPYLCQALTDAGMHGEACGLALRRDYPSWLYPVTRGATTVWEHWDGIRPDGSFWPARMNSFNHYAYGSIGDWLYRNILGIAPDPDRPGFRNVIVRPLPGEGFTQASGWLDTLYGRVEAAWVLAGGRFGLELTLPPNTSATVALPARAEAEAYADGGFVPLETAPEGGEGRRFAVEAGRYRFSCAL